MNINAINPTLQFNQLSITLPLKVYIPALTMSLTIKIQTTASEHSIPLTSLPFHSEALSSIQHLSSQIRPSSVTTAPSTATRIDTHTHAIPSWFRALEPQAAGRETPEWGMHAHLEFMNEHGIKRSILSISTPGANAFSTEEDAGVRKAKTIALARLLNEYLAEVCRLVPGRFSWMAVVPLPYVEQAIEEARYALEELGAVGVGVLTNHEGWYVGDERFDGFWKYLQGRGREVVFIHPTEPVIRLEDGRVVNSRPCKFLFRLFESVLMIRRSTASFWPGRILL